MEEHEKSMHIQMKAKTRIFNQPNYLKLLNNKSLVSLETKKLLTAAGTNNIEAVILLLKLGINPNVYDISLRTPLHLAASRGYKEIVGTLLAHGADPNQKDIIGNTPLHLAVCTNHIETVTILLDAGTDLNSLDQYGKNPLQLAQSKLKIMQNNYKAGTVEMVQLRVQLEQVINLMLSISRKQQHGDMNQLEMMKLKINDSSDTQLDDQMSILLSAVENMSLKTQVSKTPDFSASRKCIS